MKVCLYSFPFWFFVLYTKLSTCFDCRQQLPENNDFLNCEKCKKPYHWQCTKLDKYIIKQHKKNPYKPWRCLTCVDKYCIKCDKTTHQNSIGSICCDKCLCWYHLNCTDLRGQGGVQGQNFEFFWLEYILKFGLWGSKCFWPDIKILHGWWVMDCQTRPLRAHFRPFILENPQKCVI